MEASSPFRRPKFAHGHEFQSELRRRVDAYFEQPGRRARDCPQMYVKTAVILLGFALAYGLLVFFVNTWIVAAPLAMLLGLLIAMIGFNIMHDGGHGAYSRSPWINRAMALSLDLVGVSSYFWDWNHGVLHHTYTSVSGHDVDLGQGLLRRLTPHQKHLAHHRWQHWYIWPLYGGLVIKWHLFDDFHDLVTGRSMNLPFPRPWGRELALLVGGKVVFFSLAFAIPMLLHPWWVVLAFYGVTVFVTGMTLTVVFQIAHCVEEGMFPQPDPGTQRLEKPWAVHQVETTVNFMRDNRLATWLLGGLNFQIEHHLFPRICHINYPALSKLVERTCQDFGVRYNVHRSFWAGIGSHARWLRRMSLPAEGI